MNNLLENLGQLSLLKLTSQQLFDFLRTEKPTLYAKIEIDLSTAQTDKEYLIQGTFFQVLEISPYASVSIRFNELSAPQIVFDSTQYIFIPFYRFFLTNTAQPGKIITLLIGDNISYLPYIRIQSIDLSEINQKTLSPLTSNIQISRLTLTTTPTQIKPAEGTRRGTLIQNMSDVNIVYIGKDNTVSITNGFPIFPYGALRLDSEKKLYTGEIWGIAEVDTEIAVLSFYE
jgi:hypothetical protein